MALVTDQTLRAKAYQRFTFQVMKNGVLDKTHTLIINPEELTQDEPARVNVTKTLAGAYIEEWGRDLLSIAISGTTGYRKRIVRENNREMDGFQAFIELRNDIYRYFLEPDGTPKQLSTAKDTYELRFFNWEDEEYYAVFPNKFTLKRSVSRPLLYRYDMVLTCLYPLSKPPQRPLTDETSKSLTDFKISGFSRTVELADRRTDMLKVLYGDNLDGMLTEREIVNQINYPGFEAYYAPIEEIAQFCTKFITALLDYNAGKVDYIDALVSDVNQMREKARNVSSSLGTMANPPHALIIRIRDLQRTLGVLGKFTPLFKENRKKW